MIEMTAQEIRELTIIHAPVSTSGIEDELEKIWEAIHRCRNSGRFSVCVDCTNKEIQGEVIKCMNYFERLGFIISFNNRSMKISW